MNITKNIRIHIRAEFMIKEGKIDEFMNLIQDMSRTVEANKPDTLDYEFYLKCDETKCIVHETCADSEAVLAHESSIASQTILPQVFSVATITGLDVYGNPIAELRRKMMVTSINPQFYNLFTGFSRL